MKKALHIGARIAKVFLSVFAILMLLFTILSTTAVNRENVSLLGFRFFIVRSDSMVPVFQAGDLTITKQVDAGTLEAGNIIAFRSIDPMNYGEVITHQIQECTQYKGEEAFVTRGIAAQIEDPYPVPTSRVLGVYQTALPRLGYLFQFLKTPAGYCLLIFLPFFLLMLWQGARFFLLLRRSHQEQQKSIQQQQEALEEKQAALNQGLAELVELKKQLEKRLAAPYSPKNKK